MNDELENESFDLEDIINEFKDYPEEPEEIIEETEEIFNILLGDNLEGRKDYIAAFGSDYLDDLDLS